MSRAKSKTGIRVARELVQSIYDKGLRPGDRYLSEADALEEHGVSRATYREAVRFLEFQGALGVKAGAGGGTVVAHPDWRNLASAMGLLLQFSGTSLSQVMAAREVLEPAMASQSACNASDEQIATMRQFVAVAEQSVADAERFLSAYRSFWHCVADATGNPVTAELWKALRALIDTGRFVPNERYRAQLVTWLRDMLAAIEARDAQAAHDLIVRFNAELAERLERDYPLRVGKVMAWSDVTDQIDDYAHRIGMSD